MRRELELALRIAELLPDDDAGRRLLTPLLVRLYGRRAAELLEAGRSVDDLPKSIPDLYFDFLRSVNPTDPSTPNYAPHQQMLDGALQIACLVVFVRSSGERWTPQEASARDCAQVLEGELPDGTRGDVVGRLIANGIIVTRVAGPDIMLRFALDPLAEVLAAFKIAEACGASALLWARCQVALQAAGPQAEGVKELLEAVRFAYGASKGWPLLDLGQAGDPQAAVEWSVAMRAELVGSLRRERTTRTDKSLRILFPGGKPDADQQT